MRLPCIDPLNGLVVRHEQTAQVTLKMLELLRAKQVLVVLGILVNKWRDLDQGYHVTSHRFRGGNPLGSPYIALGFKSKVTAKVELKDKPRAFLAATGLTL